MNTSSARGSPFASVRTKQPGKALWATLFILLGPLRLALLLIYFTPKRFRQHPQWTYHQAVSSAVLKLWFKFASTVEYRTPKSLESGTDKERFVVVKPASSESYTGMASDKMIQPEPIGGMWYPRRYDASCTDNTKIVIHFHGGAYVLGGVRPNEGGWGPEILANTIHGLVLCPQYRLSSNPKGRFPAALQDGITAYNYLLDEGISNSRIVISGDSAGGNLVLALLRYLEESPTQLPLPFAALLWSPWLDLAADPHAVERHRNTNADYLTSELIKWGVRTYRPSFLEANHPYLSPLNNAFATSVPIFMQHGTAEVLVDEQKAFCQQMLQISGNRVERMETANAPHDTFLGGKVLGFENEAVEAAKAAGEFLESHEKQN